MAAKSPAELKKEGEELKSLFAKIKKKQHNCAILMSKDGIVVEAHIKKSPEILQKAAKKAGGMPKGAWGTITMEGPVLILDPINDKVPGNLGKVAKKFFTERGLKFRLDIKEPEEGSAPVEAVAEAEQEETRQTASEEETENDTATGRATENEESQEEEARADGGSAEAPGGSGADTPSEKAENNEESKSRESASDKALRAEMKSWLDGKKKKLGPILKNRDSENGKLLVAALTDFAKAQKASKLDKAQDALDEVERVLEKADQEFTLSENQRSAVMKELEKIETEIAEITSELT